MKKQLFNLINNDVQKQIRDGSKWLTEMQSEMMNNKQKDNSMPKIVAKLKVRSIWLIEKTDLSPCKACNEVIYGDMIRLWIITDCNDVRLHGDQTNVVLCESCFNVLNG